MQWRSQDAWYSRAGWSATALVALTLLGAGRSGAEMPDRTMSLHIAPATPGQNPCAPELIGNLTCGDFVVDGDSTGPQWLYIIATGLLCPLRSVVLSLWWGPGFEVDGWTPCTDGEETHGPYPGWPAAGNALLIRWDPWEPYSGLDHIVVLGACHVLPGSAGLVSVIGPPGWWQVLIHDGCWDPSVWPLELGVVDVASNAGGGYNPCQTIATPVVEETWGRLKSLYR